MYMTIHSYILRVDSFTHSDAYAHTYTTINCYVGDIMTPYREGFLEQQMHSGVVCNEKRAGKLMPLIA